MGLKDDIERCYELLQAAERILIGAGAGLSAAAGLDYTDKEAFTRDYPALVKKGFTMKAELIGFMNWSPEEMWGYWAQHINDFRFKWSPHPVYTKLLDLVQKKDYFVLTSNVDAMFVKSGFSEERIFTPQGDYALMQCLKPCSNQTWPIKPIIDRILPYIDKATQTVTDSNLIPYCPNCGGSVFPNVRGGNWFVEEPYKQQQKRFSDWIKKQKDQQLIVIEIGSGFNTPVVVRWQMEQIVYHYKSAHLVRVNTQYPQIPEEITDRSLSFQCNAKLFVSALWEINEKRKNES